VNWVSVGVLVDYFTDLIHLRGLWDDTF